MGKIQICKTCNARIKSLEGEVSIKTCPRCNSDLDEINYNNRAEIIHENFKELRKKFLELVVHNEGGGFYGGCLYALSLLESKWICDEGTDDSILLDKNKIEEVVLNIIDSDDMYNAVIDLFKKQRMC